LDPRFASSYPAEDDGLLKAINIYSMTSFEVEVKLVVLCHKILGHVKNPYSIKEILVGKISRTFFTCFAARCLLVTARELGCVNQK
jgi:hypothetical protein